MTTSTLLRVAAMVAMLQFFGHTMLFVRAKPTHGNAEVAVVEAMKAHRFNFGGSMRSYWNMYFGYGIEAAFVCLVEAILFWQLATIAGIAPTMVQPIMVLFIIANIAHACLVARYFFLVPLVPDVLIAVLLLTATVISRRAPAPRSERSIPAVSPPLQWRVNPAEAETRRAHDHCPRPWS